MEISTPREPVYYYECSAGSFRLTYFMPRSELERLHDEGKLAARALDDLPDGVDLGCTEPDFAEFKQLYGYRPPLPPDDLRRAFYALFSTTRDWRLFRGSGFIPKADLERQVDTVERELQRRNLTPTPTEVPLAGASLERRREQMESRAEQEIRIEATLRELPVSGVDPGKTLRQQQFSKIEMGTGKPAEEVFAELHQKHKR